MPMTEGFGALGLEETKAMSKSKAGFTIVELLIVIVVIAILAAISVVAYTGIRQRAENTKTVSGVSQYAKLLASYKAINGDYPNHIGVSYACLGIEYVNDICHIGTDGSTALGTAHTTFNQAIQSIGSLPILSTKNLTLSSGAIAAGATFSYTEKMIRYHLDGTQAQCDAGGTRHVYGSVVQCRIILN